MRLSITIDRNKLLFYIYNDRKLLVYIMMSAVSYCFKFILLTRLFFYDPPVSCRSMLRFKMDETEREEDRMFHF